MKRIAILSMLCVLPLVACSPAGDEQKVTKDGITNGYIPSGSKRVKRRTASIPVYVGPRNGSFGLVENGVPSFGLADATNFSILLTGCQTGWTTTVTAADPSLDVYKDDRDCLAKLLTFEWQGKTYQPKSGSDFTTWQASDTATFENNADPSDTMEVRVVSTLANPVSGTEAISYQFYEITNGGDTDVLEDDVGDPHALTVGGQSSPAFTVKSVAFMGTTATGGGKFKFKMECDEDVDLTDTAGTITADACAENDLAHISYKLVEDTYSSVLTLTDARTIFGTAGTGITLATDTIAIGAETTTHGGFNTVTLDGPDAMHTHPNMILILRVDGGNDSNTNNDSFTYFNVDVEILSYP